MAKSCGSTRLWFLSMQRSRRTGFSMVRTRSERRATFVLRCLTVVLAGCGGGGGEAGRPPANHAPIAGDDVATTMVDAPLTLADATLLDNDRDEDGQTLTIVTVGNPKHGTVSHFGTQVRFV